MQGQLSNPGGKKGQGMEMSTYNDLINPMAEEKKKYNSEECFFHIIWHPLYVESKKK